MTDHHRVFMGCLIGEPIRRDAHGLPTLEEVRRGLWQKFSAFKEAELFFFFLNYTRGTPGTMSTDVIEMMT